MITPGALTLSRRLHKDVDLNPEGLHLALKYRFGLASASHFSKSTQPYKMLDWKSVQRMLCVVEDREHIPEDLQDSSLIMMSCLNDKRYPPSDICDIIPGSTQPHPMSAVNQNLNVTRTRDGYVIHSTVSDAADVTWDLFISRSSTLFEIVRRGWVQSKVVIAKELLSRGIAFHTVLEVPLPDLTVALPPKTPLVTYPFGYKFTTDDYVVYEARRDSLLRQPRGRAALMKGGIMWRLALEVLDEESVILWLERKGEYEFRIETQDRCFVDDDLSEVELDLIAGVSHVHTSKCGVSVHKLLVLISWTGSGMLGENADASGSSWWPKHRTWQQSGYDVGVWTWHNEMWFRRRREAILQGTATPMIATRWRQALKGNKQGIAARSTWETRSDTAYRLYRPYPT